MAAANDNQGLKIAVAALVMLVFILGVTNYFAFSSASQMTAKAEDANKKASASADDARKALEQANTYLTMIGHGNQTDFDSAKAAIKKDIDRITAEIQALGAEYTTAVAEVQKAGEPDPKLDELRQVGQGLVASFVSEPNENKVFIKSLERLKDIMLNESRLMRELSFDYRKLRQELTAANSVNSVEVAKYTGARDQATKEKQDEIAKIKTELQSLYDQLTNLQNQDKDKTNSITDLTNKLADATANLTRVKTDTARVMKSLKGQLALRENELGKSIGRVTYIDYNRGEARVSVNKQTGARPMMTFTVFDRGATGIPTDKPKGTLELINVGDPSRREYDSTARIVDTKEPTNPIRYNDQIYSPAFTPDNPQRFALIGRIDVNRDGRDDRDDLIRLIEQAGGLIEYDLPPPGVDRTPGRLAVERGFARLGEPVPPITGRASGRISSYTKNYIVDDRKPLIGNSRTDEVPLTAEGNKYSEERSAATKEASANGVPPMPIERILSQLGYTAPVGGVPGNNEMKNRGAIKTLVKPKAVLPGATPPASPDAATTPPPADGSMPK